MIPCWGNYKCSQMSHKQNILCNFIVLTPLLVLSYLIRHNLLTSVSVKKQGWDDTVLRCSDWDKQVCPLIIIYGLERQLYTHLQVVKQWKFPVQVIRHLDICACHPSVSKCHDYYTTLVHW